MMKKLALLIGLIISSVAWTCAQTPHGVLVTWTNPSVPTGGFALAGINLFRAVQTAGNCGTYTQLNATPVPGTAYPDPSAGLSLTTTYCYSATEQDINGNVSAASSPATVTTPAAWPVNPGAPAVTVKIQ
jgi:hypothetical protein